MFRRSRPSILQAHLVEGNYYAHFLGHPCALKNPTVCLLDGAALHLALAVGVTEVRIAAVKVGDASFSIALPTIAVVSIVLETQSIIKPARMCPGQKGFDIGSGVSE